MNLVPILVLGVIPLLLPGEPARAPRRRPPPRVALEHAGSSADSHLTRRPAGDHARGTPANTSLQTTLDDDEEDEDISAGDAPDLDLLAPPNLGAVAHPNPTVFPRPPCGFGPSCRIHPLRC